METISKIFNLIFTVVGFITFNTIVVLFFRYFRVLLALNVDFSSKKSGKIFDIVLCCLEVFLITITAGTTVLICLNTLGLI